MWLTPCSSTSPSVRAAWACETEPSAAAPKIVRVLSWPVRPNGAVGIIRPEDTGADAATPRPAPCLRGGRGLVGAERGAAVITREPRPRFSLCASDAGDRRLALPARFDRDGI